MTHAIERIQTMIVAGIIVVFIMCIIDSCVDFLNNQNFDELWNDNEMYDFTNDSYIAKQNIVLCGVEYNPGDVIQKDLFNKCNN